MNKQSNNITRRDAVKKMGMVAATAAISMSGVGALASCAETVAAQLGRPLKVLLLNGSPRRAGNTFTLLSEIASQLKKYSIESEIFQLAYMLQQFTTGTAKPPKREQTTFMNFIR